MLVFKLNWFYLKIKLYSTLLLKEQLGNVHWRSLGLRSTHYAAWTVPCLRRSEEEDNPRRQVPGWDWQSCRCKQDSAAARTNATFGSCGVLARKGKQHPAPSMWHNHISTKHQIWKSAYQTRMIEVKNCYGQAEFEYSNVT